MKGKALVMSTLGIRRAFVALIVAVCAVVSCVGASAKAEDDLFKILSGVSNAKLERVEPSGSAAKLVGANRKANDYRFLDQRFAALTDALAQPSVARSVSRKNGQGVAPIFFAIYSGDGPLVVDALLAAGADPNATLFGAPALWHALNVNDANSTQIALALLDYGADPNAKTDSGETLLGKAASLGVFWVVQRLLVEGADPKATSNGKTPDALCKDASTRDLVKNWGKKPYPFSALNPDEPKLHRAAAQNNLQRVKRLLADGADPNAKWNGVKAVDMTTDAKVRAALGGKGTSKVDFSEYRLGHVYRGDYEKSNRHAAGGHSHAAYLYMFGANQKPEIHAFYENGVKVCSVERRSSRRAADDPANPQHTVFPSHWTRGDIVEAVNSIALAGVAKLRGEDSARLEENYNGVRIVVILRTNDKRGVDIITAYPIYSRQPRSGDGKFERLDDAKRALNDRTRT